MATVLIKNVQLLDGTGRPAFKSDVLVKNNIISAIDSAINYQADETIDGMGRYLAPGFIDVNNRADRYLDIFSEPSQKKFLLQGVTAIIGGQGGISLAPLLYGSLQSIRSFADTKKINVDWHSFGEFLNVIKKRPLGINFGSLAGYNTAHRALLGEPTARNLTPNESKVLSLILKSALQEGALGISINLNDSLISQISYFELKKTAELAAKNKKIFTVDLKDKKKELPDSVKKLVYLARETGSRILINDFLPFNGLEKEYNQAVKLIEENSASSDIYFNLFPCEENIDVISTYLPDWMKEANQKLTLENINNADLKKKIIKSFPLFQAKKMIIINAPIQPILIGQSLREFSLNRNLDDKEGLLELMKITKLKAEISSKDIDLKTATETLTREQTLIASSATAKVDSCKSFQKFLKLAEKEKILPIETAIKKLTRLPSKILGLDRRGEIKEGYFADLVIFKDAEIQEVLVNGKRAVKRGKFQNELAGKIL